ncbi:MAG: hypothetical protein R3E89_12055 [Thiolinea sp.]
MKNLFRYLVIHPLLVLLLVVLLVIGAVLVLSFTQLGTGILVNAAERFVPALELDGVRGALLGQVEADHLVWERDGVKVDAQQALFKPDVQLKYPPEINISQLRAERLVIDLPPGDDSTPYVPITVPDLALPVDANLADVQVGELIINQGETTFVIKDVELNARTRDQQLLLDNLSGNLVGDLHTVEVTARGEMGLNLPHPISVEMDIRSESPVLGDGELKLRADGQLQDYQVLLSGNWQYGEFPEYQIAASGSGTFEKMDLEDLQLNGEAGNATVSGELVWAPELSWDLKGSAEQLRPGAVLSDLTGNLDAALTTQGSLKGELDVTVKLSELKGEFQDVPVQTSLEARLQGKDLILRNLDALIGDNHLQAAGQGDEQLSIDWQLDAPALEQLHPELKGQLAGQGKLSGKIDGSEFAVEIERLQGELLGYPLEAEGGLSLQDQLLAARQLRVKVGDNTVTLDGTADENTGIDWVLDASKLSQLYPELSGQLKGRGNAKGLLDGSRLALRVDQLDGTVKDLPVSVQGAVRLEDQELTADQVSLKVGKNEVLLDGKADEDRGINWRIDAPELGILHPELSGRLKGRGNVKGLLDGSRAALRIDELSGKVREFPVEARGALRLEDQLISADKFQLAVGKNKVRLDGVADEASGVDWIIDAPELETLHPALRGNLRGGGNAKGQLDGSRLAVRVNALRGEVQGFPVQAEGEIRLKDQLLSARRFRVDIGKNRIRLDGDADENRGIDWVIDAPELGMFHPELAGSELKGRGNARGKLDGSQAAGAHRRIARQDQGLSIAGPG